MVAQQPVEHVAIAHSHSLRSEIVIVLHCRGVAAPIEIVADLHDHYAACHAFQTISITVIGEGCDSVAALFHLPKRFSALYVRVVIWYSLALVNDRSSNAIQPLVIIQKTSLFMASIAIILPVYGYKDGHYFP